MHADIHPLYNPIMNRLLCAFLVGAVGGAGAYLLPRWQSPKPPRALRVRYGAQVCIWAFGIAGLVALLPKYRLLFQDPSSLLLFVLALYALSCAQVISRLSLRGYLYSWDAVTELFECFTAKESVNKTRPLVVVEGRGAFGAIYAAHIPSFLSSVSDLSKKEPQFTLVPLEYLESISTEFRDWAVTRSDAYLLIVGPENEDGASVGYPGNMCWGKKHVVEVWLFEQSRHSQMLANDWSEEGIRLSLKHEMPYLSKTHQEQLAPLKRDLITSTAILHSETVRLSHLASVVERLQTSGFQPIARAYTKYRLSASDTERLLALLDCFEVLLKTGTIVLISLAKHEGRDLVNEVFAKHIRKGNLENLATGDWLALLQRGVDTCASYGTFGKELSDFWEAPLTTPNFELIDTADRSGLAMTFDGPRTYGGWLPWLVTFRNRTRGHGSIREFSSRMLWPSLHECFLTALAHVPKTGFNLFASAGSSSEIAISNGYLFGPQNSLPIQTNHVKLHLEGSTIDVNPFLCVSSGRLLMLGGKHGGHYSYIDYLDGSYCKIKVTRLLSSGSPVV